MSVFQVDYSTAILYFVFFFNESALLLWCVFVMILKSDCCYPFAVAHIVSIMFIRIKTSVPVCSLMSLSFIMHWCFAVKMRTILHNYIYVFIGMYMYVCVCMHR